MKARTLALCAAIVLASGCASTTGTSPTTTTTTTKASTTTAPAPPQTTGTTTTTTLPKPKPRPPLYEPPPVKPLITPALPGEGKWTAVDTWAKGPPSILTTTFRTDPAQPSTVAYCAWFRASTTLFALYLGYKGPGPTALARGPEMVPLSGRPDLLSTFNSGYYEQDDPAGFYTHGTLYYPMVKGHATAITYKDGRVDIIDWQGGTSPGPDVLMARQSLTLIVDGGRPTPKSALPYLWGPTLYGAPEVWRTGLGIDRQGNLIYVAAPAQTAASLAQIFVDLGAVRAMQTDINPEWPILITYGGPGAASPSIFVPNPASIPDRFLFPATKDFFAIYLRVPGMTQQPW